MSNVTVISLAPDGTYSQRSASLRDKYVEVSGTDPSAILVDRATVFQRQKPLQLNTTDELLKTKAPVPTLDDAGRQVLTCLNDGYPVTHDDTEWASKIRQEAKILNQVTRNDKLQEQAYQRTTEERRTLAFVIIASAAGGIAVLVVLIMASVMFF